MTQRQCIRYGRGCSDGGVAVPGRSRCRAHGGDSWSRIDPAAKRGYGADWQGIRERVLRESPNCEVCGAPATDVDHRIARADGGTDARSNLRGLCHPCHKKHTAEQNHARRKRKSKG